MVNMGMRSRVTDLVGHVQEGLGIHGGECPSSSSEKEAFNMTPYFTAVPSFSKYSKVDKLTATQNISVHNFTFNSTVF